MPDTMPDLQPALASSDDPFFAAVVCSVHRQEARAHLAEQLTGQPFRYDLSSTAWISGVPARLLRRLCREGDLQAIKLSGWWLLHRDDFNGLLAAKVALR